MHIKVYSDSTVNWHKFQVTVAERADFKEAVKWVAGGGVVMQSLFMLT